MFKTRFIAFGVVLFLLGGLGYVLAQDDVMVIFHKDVFKRCERPPVVFTHEKHVEVLGGDESCAKCHHVYDEKEHKLVYEEGEETGCADCHGPKDERMPDGTKRPSLMNAYHINCIKCHREFAKAGKKTGPYTCGECHKKENWKLVEKPGKVEE